MSSLNAISPIDGRYSKSTSDLIKYWTEEALIRYRIIVEGEYLIALANEEGVKLRKFTEKEKLHIRALYNLETVDIEGVKKIEAVTNHDVKAVEYFMKERLKETSLRDCIEWIHFALTSEDTNNLSYALMISETMKDVMIPAISSIIDSLEGFASKYAKVPMLARTHGQSASPTTLGKEFKVFSFRLSRQLNQINEYKVLAKLNGATGNYNAHVVAYPDVNWKKFTENFIKNLSVTRKIKLEANLITAQIEPHDTYAELFDILRRINIILIDFNQDMWRYISDHWIIQKTKAGEIGSSTMPHKINPIDFENSEGNLGLANTLFTYFSSKLPISRLQRDLSDSTVERNFGSAFAYCLIAYKSLLRGLGKISADEIKIREDLHSHQEIIAEAIQTVLRREGVELPYESLKDLTRGRTLSRKDFDQFIDAIAVSNKIKSELKKITVENYIGIADKMALA